MKFFYTLCLIIVSFAGIAQQTQYQYLSGKDKDHTIAWDFYINAGMKSGEWDKIQVPSNWEQQGFGTYNYYKDTKNPEEEGLYKHQFKVNENVRDKEVFLVFEGVMTDAEIKVNGKIAGPIHQGGYYRFKYNITPLLIIGGDNLLEVKVKKRSANESINQAERKADFWLFGGIFRPVYLEIKPQKHIDRIAIDAKSDGKLAVNVYSAALTTANSLQIQVQSLSGKLIAQPVILKVDKEQELFTLKQEIKNIIPWNPEQPQLYNLIVSVLGPKTITHQTKTRFGFRTIEMRPQDGFYVNDKKVIFKGVNRHSHWPESGRTLSKELNIADVKLMKEMNMNSVRMSHYPPDQDFLDVCDSLGLFVIDELTGWQAKYDTEAGRKLVKELVDRDVNHASIVLWANGNEGGWNTALDNDYGKYDPQNRFVIHPWEKFNGIDTKHYPNYNYVLNSVLYGKDVFFPTEFMHGLQDGGHAASLTDFWNLMLQHPYGAGGFLWSFADEGTARTDQNGKIDVAGNAAPDGILGPHREKEASFYAIKEIWSPIQISNKYIPVNFDGNLTISNKYIYTNLNKCTFSWKLVTLPKPNEQKVKIDAEAKAAIISLAPGETGFLKLNIPKNWKTSDVLYLTAFGSDQQEVFTWSWSIQPSVTQVLSEVEKTVSLSTAASEVDSSLVINTAGIQYFFSKNTGYMQKVINSKGEISLSNGPIVAGANHQFKKLNHYQKGEDYIVEPQYEGKTLFNVKWIFSKTKDVELDYQYSISGVQDFIGITFNYPENLITGMRWEGRGPYRVWKNRLEGQQFGVWQKDYNNAITGESWNYPEFKGYHDDVYWVTIQNKQSPFTVYTDKQGIFFQMLKPQKAAGATNENTTPVFPNGDLGFLKAISPIGTKFQSADVMGPQSQKNVQLNYTPISGKLWFDFK